MYMHQSSLLAEPSQSIVDPKYAPHLLIDKLHSLVQRSILPVIAMEVLFPFIIHPWT